MEEVIERVKQEALLSDEEIDRAWPNSSATGQALLELSFESIAKELLRCGKFIAQAQLEKLLKNKKVRIEADNQELPKYDYERYLIPATDVGFVQQHMIDDGWVKCLERKEK